MYIIKRNGEKQKLDISKIKKVTNFACEGYNNRCNPNDLESSARLQFVDGMTTREIQKTLIQTAIEKVLSKDPNGTPIIVSEWSYVASRLFLYDLYKEAELSNYGYKNFEHNIKKRIKDKKYIDFYNYYTKSEIQELANYIKPERDDLLSYDGSKLLFDRYLLKDNNNVNELPQERFMIIAMHIAIPEEEKRVFYAKKFYDLMSQLKMTVATPTLANSGMRFHQLSSCFISTVEDDLWSIYDVNQKFAHVSKNGGALGIYMGKVRALNSDIRGYKNVSSGVIPFIRLYNDTAISVDQLGKRKGSASITLDVWHKDLYDFLDLKTNNGDDRRKAHDIFPALSIPDLFMKRLKERKKWSLFDPYEVNKKMGYFLEDYFDDKDNFEFTKRYEECENNPNLSRVTVTALDVMKKVLVSAVETGTPFIFFRDTVNRANPNKHAGMIYSSNLCHEIAQNMSYTKKIKDNIHGATVVTEIISGDFVTCNLNSINLGRVSKEELKECIPLQIRMLDNVITINGDLLPDARITCDKYRAIGLGVSGYHHHLVNNDIKWESEEHLNYANELFEDINYYAIKASMELAKEKGKYSVFKGSEWENGKYFTRRNYTSPKWVDLQSDIAKYGMRNGYLIAVAPTGSTSNIANTSAGIDPIFKKYFIEEKKGIIIPKTAPDLCDENFWLYKEAHTINQDWSIDACGIRQRHIDQAQSFNLYITPEKSASEILSMYIRCWEKDIKTIYYVRNQSLEVDECTSCSS